MRIKSVLLVIIAAFIQACGAATLKSATSVREGLFVLLAMLAFCGGFFLYYKGLSKLKLFVAQPLFSSTMFLATTLISILFFKESISMHQISGIICIIGGMVIMGTKNQEQIPVNNQELSVPVLDTEQQDTAKNEKK